MKYSAWMSCLCLMILAICITPGRSDAQVTSVEIEANEHQSEIIKFNSKAPIQVKKTFTLANPDRVVVDIPRVASGAVKLPASYKGKLLKSIRFGQFDATTSRIVLDMRQPVDIVSSMAGAPFTIEIAASDKTGDTAPAVEAKPLIVIDAGHGGQDPGALGLHGTHEKDVTLNYARALREGFLQTGRYRAELTRSDDRFITLPERVAIARKLKADIFISLHADSNPKADARGLSVYTLSENASDEEAAALAEHENKADIIPGIDLNTADPDVASILIELTQRETMNKSAQMADAIVKSFDMKINKLAKTHRFAGFRVLKGPDIPAVLIELGFLTNQTDERLLLTSEYRTRVVESIIKGVDRFRAGE